ncbi:hypothetical protein HALLA_03850 (plasmid) [Halostagnicola larsenii XH-48]|uniref:Uncharacterized protein n=1 Tax=Halostagnicola larsenii XH-48 TaxID=797299 RepID=W0JW34_9EURY|nr:hypothetical protein HALLA_03850 [Halostagnicola larsenii XH-48]
MISDSVGVPTELLFSIEDGVRGLANLKATPLLELEVSSIEFASEIVFSLTSNIIDTVPEVNKKPISDEFFAPSVNVLAGEAHTIAVSHLFGRIRTIISEMLENPIIGA